MPFSSWPLAFHQNVAEAIGRIRRQLSPRRLPKTLYHYTSLNGALGIIDSRALWAACVEDLDDPSEIRHGVEIVQAEVKRRQELCLPEIRRAGPQTPLGGDHRAKGVDIRSLFPSETRRERARSLLPGIRDSFGLGTKAALIRAAGRRPIPSRYLSALAEA